MRWPWSRPKDEEAAAAAPQADRTPGPSASGWAFLPPLQRTLHDPILPVTRPTEFPSELPAWRSPAFTGALGHAVVDTVPGGVIDGDGGGVGAPQRTVGPAPELTLLPPPRPTALQRSAVTGRPPLGAPAAPVAAAEPPVPMEPAAPDLRDVVRPEAPVAALTTASSLGLPLVQRSAVPDLPDLAAPQRDGRVEPFADVAPADLPDRPPLGPSPASAEAGRPAVQRVLAPSASAAAPPARPRLGLGPPLASTPATAVPIETDVPPPPAPADLAPVPPVAPDPAADAGFTEVPIQRSVARPAPPRSGQPHGAAVPLPPTVAPAPELTLAGTGEPRATIQRSPSPDGHVAAHPPPAEPMAGHHAEHPVEHPVEGIEEPVEVTGPRADTVQEAGHHPELDAGAPWPTAPDESSPVAIEPPSTPLVTTPLPLAGGIATSIQRGDLLPGPGAPTPSLVVRPAPLVPSPPTTARERVVRVQRLAAGPPGATPLRVQSDRTPARSGSTGPGSPGAGAAVVQRMAAAFTGASPTTSAAPPAPAGEGLAGPSAAAPGRGAPVRVDRAPGIDGRPPPLVVSRSVAPVVAPVVGSPGASPATVSSLALAVPRPAAEPTVSVQTAPDGTEPPLGGPAGAEPPTGATPEPVTVQAAATPAAPAAGPGGAAGGSATGDVDALAQRLFPAVLRRIKAELLLDRERRGVRTDPW